MDALVFVIAIGVLGYFYPALNEDVPTNCQAVEMKLLSYTGARSLKLLTGISHGELAKAFAKMQYKDIPPQMACAMVYWDALFNKDKYRKAAKEIFEK